jgi:hypothetical protein
MPEACISYWASWRLPFKTLNLRKFVFLSF